MSKISVIIPCYNAEKYIKKCFDGLEKQIFKEFDVIVMSCLDKSLCIFTFIINEIGGKLYGI